MKPGRSARRRAGCAIWLGLALLTASCGTRANREEGGNAAAASASLGSATRADPGAETDAHPANFPEGTSGLSSQSSSVTTAAGAAPRAAQTAPGSGDNNPGKDVKPVGDAMRPGVGRNTTTAGNRPAEGNEPAMGSAPGGTTGLPRATPTTKSPAVIASVGTLSGPIGGTVSASVGALQAWTKYVNDKGGVNGHPVRLIVFDDGADPARHRAQVQDAIEQRGAIAFVMNNEPVSGESSVDYITSKRVPVMGGSGVEAWFYKSPMYFPPASMSDAAGYGGLAGAAQQLVSAGKTRLGIATCVEAKGCDDVGRVWADSAKSLGFELVARMKVSLAQPDFTAECLNVRNAGAQVLFLGMDSASIQRWAANCARQGYRPAYGTTLAAVADRFTDDPNLGEMIQGINVFPWFASGTPATDEFQKVMRTYGSGLVPGVATSTGWVSAKLFEKAAANLPEPPTSEGVLQGLWSLRNDTLGGLTMPLTFVMDQRASQVACWFTVQIKKAAWTSPDGFRLNCRP